MNKRELEDTVLDCKKMLAFYEGMRTNCKTCDHKNIHFDCAKHGQRVPEEYRDVGCDDWEYDDVPF